jgi:beta-glucanase (GH16 family)
LSLRVFARVNGPPGAVAGFFTYRDDTAESDIEILTRDPPTQAHFSNQPTEDPRGNPVPGASVNVSISPSGGWDVRGWAVYRLDWLPGRSVWYANGERVAETDVNVPYAQSMVILNMWSSGGSFSGLMRVNETAYLDVGWIEMAYNISSSAGSRPGGVRCSIDKTVGNPVPSAGLRKVGDVSLWSLFSLLMAFLVVGY